MSAARAPGRRPKPGPGPEPRGFALVGVIFLLVVVAAAVAALVGLVVNSSHAGALDVQSARASQAARAGLQWAAWQLRDPRATLNPGLDSPPPCLSATQAPSLPAPLDAYTVNLSCQRTPALTDSPPHHLEDQHRIAVYVITAEASTGTSGTPERVERRLEMRLEVCKDPTLDGTDRNCR